MVRASIRRSPQDDNRFLSGAQEVQKRENRNSSLQSAMTPNEKVGGLNDYRMKASGGPDFTRGGFPVML